MDIADQADDIIENHLKDSLKRISTTALVYSGFCLYCGDECGQARYCDRYCREDHEKQLKRNR